MKLSKTGLIGIVAAALLIGGGVAYAATRYASDEQVNDQQEEQQVRDNQQHQQLEPTPSTDSDEPNVTDKVTIPSKVQRHIKKDYPDYVIEDTDKEVRANQVYYEVELEHRDPRNESTYELTYDKNWKLIDVKFDRD